MDDRGWGWTGSEVRQVQLVEWLVPQSSSVTYVAVGPLYDALHDQRPVTIQPVHDELRDLEQRSLIVLAVGIGGIESYGARPHRGAALRRNFKHDGPTSASARLPAGTRWSTGFTRETRPAR